MQVINPQPLFIEDKIKEQSQWLLTMIYVLAWEWVLAGIVQGQIVDAYAQLRERKASLDDDTEAKCLVCSLERFICDKKCGGFEAHVENDHSPISYLFWMYYLHHRAPADMNGMEHYAAQRIAEEEEDWLPISTCSKMEVHLDSLYSQLSFLLPWCT